jgi:NAD(P)H-flavin reductase
MTRNVLLLGRRGIVVDDVENRLHMPDVEVFGGTGIEDVRAIFAQATIDHVIMGAGIDLEARLEIVREIFHLSEATTVHMKDVASGPQGLLPFVRSILTGLEEQGANNCPS